MHLLSSLGSILARAQFQERTHATSSKKIMFASYRAPIYTTEWRAAMWIKCLAGLQKCQALIENEPRPFDQESRVQSNILRHRRVHTFRASDCVCVYSCWLYLLVSPLKSHSPDKETVSSLQNLTKSLIHCNWLICLCSLPAAGDLRPYLRKKTLVQNLSIILNWPHWWQCKIEANYSSLLLRSFIEYRPRTIDI